MNPPLSRDYSEEEVNEEIIHSAKAYLVCHSPAEVFARCRKGVEGSVVSPEKCEMDSVAVFKCFQDVKKVPEKCGGVFGEALKCLNGGRYCEDEVQEYLRCDHPAMRVYEGYQ